MVAAVAPYIDTSISKTVNVPADYPYEDFQGLYLQAWQSGPEGPGHLPAQQRAGLGAERGAPLALGLAAARPPCRAADGANQRLRLDRLPAPVLASLRWPKRPELPGGNPAWSYMIQHPHGDFALFVGELPAEAGPGLGLFEPDVPFEVWVNGAEQPRGMGALAKTLSMDMRANDASLAAPEARRPGHRGRGALLRDAHSAQHGEKRSVPRRGGGHRGRDPLALRAAGRAAGRAAPRRWSMPCSAATNPAPAPPARWPGRWTSTTMPPARASPSR
jgi:hypothetical protein